MSVEQIWHVQLLGGLTATSEQGTFEKFRTRKTSSLFAFLALHAGRNYGREELIDLFWQDDELDQGRQKLRLALTSIRQGVGDALVADRQSVRIDAARCDTDVRQFRQLLKRAAASSDPESDLVRAVEIYKGELLPGTYDEWVHAEREALNVEFETSLRQLGSFQRAAEKFSEAASTYYRLFDLNPFESSDHLNLLRALTALGKTESVQRHLKRAREIFGQLSEDFLEYEPRESRNAPERPPLPDVKGRFVGRESDLEDVCSLLGNDRTRLVTLIGPSGIGKTRLAIETGNVCAGSDRQVLFVSLLQALDESTMVRAISRALSRDEQGLPATARGLSDLCELLPPTVLILDNLEQLVEKGAPDLIRVILETQAHFSVLATSQRPLGIPGELLKRIPPLSVPITEDIRSIAAAPSVRLFLERAAATGRALELTTRNAAEIASICQVLEGVPLAIELAAGWTDVLTPAEILTRLNKSLPSLTSRREPDVSRHRALRTAIQWSYDLLSSERQELFKRLSLFEGSWNVQAAEAVGEIVDGSAAMIEFADGSLVSVDTGGQETRFHLLESIRQFANESLTKKEAERAAGLFKEHYFNKVMDSLPAYRPERVSELKPDEQNLDAAFDLLLKSGDLMDLGKAAVMACDLGSFWWQIGNGGPAIQQFEILLERLPKQPTPTRARVLNWIGNLKFFSGDSLSALEWYQRYLAEGRQLQDENIVTSATGNIGMALSSLGRYEESLPSHLHLLERRRESGTAYQLGTAHTNTATALFALGRRDEALALTNELLSLCVDDPNLGGLKGLACSSLAEDAWLQGELSTAVAFAREAYTIYTSIPESQRIAETGSRLALLSCENGDPSSALQALESVLRIVQPSSSHHILGNLFEAGAVLAAHNQQSEFSGQLFSIAERLRGSDSLVRAPGVAQKLEALRKQIAANEPKAFSTGVLTGRILSVTSGLQKLRYFVQQCLVTEGD